MECCRRRVVRARKDARCPWCLLRLSRFFHGFPKTVNRGDDLFHKIRLRYYQPAASRWHRYILRRIRRELHALATAELFSLMTTFNIGFRELNFGRWIRMIQPREFDIGSRGWPRVVSGLQSLLSVGLVALSLLSYFGRPFEN